MASYWLESGHILIEIGLPRGNSKFRRFFIIIHKPILQRLDISHFGMISFEGEISNVGLVGGINCINEVLPGNL